MGANLREECWEQILSLLGNRGFYFKAEHWPAFIELVDWHHILIDVLPRISAEDDSHEFSADQLDKLHKKNLFLRRKALNLFQLQCQISEYFLDRGIRHLFFKGVVLSEWLYGSTTSRQCRDIDLIVHPEDHAIASQRLEEIGCTRFIPRPNLPDNDYSRYQSAMKDVSYLHKGDSLIELHWALRAFPEAFKFDFDEAYESRLVLDFEQSALPVFSHELHLRYVAAHGCLSHWGRLRWLLDWKTIAEQSDIDWQGVVNNCATQREIAYIRKAFLLLERQMGAVTPDTNTLTPDVAALAKATRLDRYCVESYRNSQVNAAYPSWLKRQLLNLINQKDFSGMIGYIRHMIIKLLASNTLAPGSPDKVIKD